MGHSLCSFILRQIPRRSPTHNAVYFTTTRLGGYNILCRMTEKKIGRASSSSNNHFSINALTTLSIRIFSSCGRFSMAAESSVATLFVA